MAHASRTDHRMSLTTSTAPTPVTPLPITPADTLHAEGYLWTASEVGRVLGLDPEAASAFVFQHHAELLRHGPMPVAGSRVCPTTGLMVPDHALNGGHLLVLHMVAQGPKAEAARKAFVRGLHDVKGTAFMVYLREAHEALAASLVSTPQAA